MELITTTFDPEFIPEFASLNLQWIETHFRVEPMDRAQLENPYSSILEPGGEIFFVRHPGQRPIGTCAMVPHGAGSFELAKMAVSPSARGLGIGDTLMQTVVDWARIKSANSITLLSNTILEPAISLYKKHGFKTVHLGDHPDYDRCNIEMILKL